MEASARKKRKHSGDVCYFCGKPDPDTNEDIPGKQFGVNEQTGGLIVPAHRKCNSEWDRDQNFFRLRMVLNAGTQPGAAYSQERELKRLKESAQFKRYLKERDKTFFDKGEMLMGLTEMDLEQFAVVFRHWAAGIHYYRRKVRAELPGSVFMAQPATLDDQKFSPQDRGEWRTTDGNHFGYWWFLPGPKPESSAIIFRLLQHAEQGYAVRFPAFPALHDKSPVTIIKKRAV